MAQIRKVSSGGIPVVATVQNPRTSGVDSLDVDTQQYWYSGTGICFSTYKVDSNNKKVAGSQTDWVGVSNGTNQLTSMVRTGGAADNGNSIGDKVQMGPTAAWAQDLADALLAQHNSDGTHKNVTTNTLAVSGNGSVGGDFAVTGGMTVGGKDVTQLVPAGVMTMFAGSSAPTGWLLCDGSSVLRATYPDLFTVIGTTYGSVDGTHFTLPNWKGKAPFGVDSSQAEFTPIGTTGGQKTLQAHTHGYTDTGHRHALWSIAQEANVYTLGGTSNRAILKGGNPDAGDGVTGLSATNISINSAGSGANNLNPYMATNFIIKT